MWNFKKNATDELIDNFNVWQNPLQYKKEKKKKRKKNKIVTDVENQLWLLKGKGRER